MLDIKNFKLPLNPEDIIKIIPQRYPFLLIDRVLEVEDEYIKGYKNLTINEDFFQGHFPCKAVMPGVLIIEALAQLVGVSEMLKGNHPDSIGMFMGIDKARFKSPAFPGDRLDLEAWSLWFKRGIGKCKAQASVDGKIVFVGELTFAFVEKGNL